MKSWKEQRYIENWTKRVDISILHQLRITAELMQARADREKDEELSKWAGTIKYLAAIASGELANFDLEKFVLPESPTASEERAISPVELGLLKRQRK